jgi:hypothetical protein
LRWRESLFNSPSGVGKNPREHLPSFSSIARITGGREKNPLLGKSF